MSPPSRSIEPCEAEYPLVPTPKEHELSQQVVYLQHEKDALEHKLMLQIKDLESQIHKLQVRVYDYTQQLQATKREQVVSEQKAIETERKQWKEKVWTLERELEQEKNDKEAQKKWRIKFTVTNPCPTIDPVDDMLAKFAQSIALLPATAALKATQAGVLPFLVHLLREQYSDIVTGSVLLALVHLSIYQKPQRRSRYNDIRTTSSSLPIELGHVVKEEITKAGVAAPLAHILETGTNPRVLTEAARLCATLSSFIPNKRILAAKNIVRLIIQKLLPPPTESETSLTPLPIPDQDHIDLASALFSALVNLSHDSEVIRSQIVNYQFVPIVVRYLIEAHESRSIQVEAIKLLGNLAYNHVVNQGIIMAEGGDVPLIQALIPGTNDTESIRASAIGIANLAYTSVNQISIGYGQGLAHLLQCLVDNIDPLVLEAAASAIAGICHGNPLNKSRVLAHNGIQVLLYVLSSSRRYQHDQDVLIAVLECLAIVVRPKPAIHQLIELEGHLVLYQLGKQSKVERIVWACARVIAILIPTPRERSQMIMEGKSFEFDKNGIAKAVLEKAKYMIYGSQEEQIPVPTWLTKALEHLDPNTTCNDVEEGEEPSECHERSYYSIESLTDISPDVLCPDFYK